MVLVAQYGDRSAILSAMYNNSRQESKISYCINSQETGKINELLVVGEKDLAFHFFDVFVDWHKIGLN